MYDADSGEAVSNRWTTAAITYSTDVAYDGTKSIKFAGTAEHSITNTTYGTGNYTVFFRLYDTLTTTDNRLVYKGNTGAEAGTSSNCNGVWENNDPNYIYEVTSDSGYPRKYGWVLLGFWCNASMTKYYYGSNVTGNNTVVNKINTTTPCDVANNRISLQYKTAAGYVDDLTVMQGDCFSDNSCFPPNLNSITFTPYFPANYTFTQISNQNFTVSVTAITGTWNINLTLNTSSVGNLTVSSTGTYNITAASGFTAGNEYLWSFNATDTSNVSNQAKTEDRLIYFAGGTSGGTCTNVTKTCVFAAGSIALKDITGCSS